jgi:hypothetical protein
VTRSPILPYLALIAIIVGFVNFFWFFGESVTMGDASQGYTEDGRYYLGNKGTYTEVDEAAWTWSVIHGTSIFVTHPLAMAGIAFMLLRYYFPSRMAGRAAAFEATERAHRIRESGSALFSGRLGGKVGEIRFSRPLLAVAVHPAGIVIKPLAMAERTILASEIRAVTVGGGVFGGRVEVAHAAMDTGSPFVIYGSDDGIVDALRRIAPDAATTSGAPPLEADGSTATTARGAPYGMPPGIWPVLNVAGLVVGGVLIAAGVLWAIPKLGPYGVLWTVGVVAITAYNLIRLLRGR